ncbi:MULTISPECIES: sugar phosphate isomerase/epimerase [Burkholderiaceae]|uniref:sugar phosphate isomerase/epimerase family protein n=1 Tax=Burkholderiaceae TaxID=119060 RepID=UPI0014244189|nr:MULTISPECIES: sugar phosphate isomerase/epimerase [Burkholderiaceae]NIF52221.1 sugar phosphate isomerase/epimerase [Burkholderia sp. Ax-1724]NIF81317.1 sugar phosphate isomerase/epimerase [Paraburkholderia sp. Cy-641]
MERQYSLAHLTVLHLAPADAIRVAARTGYDCVGLRLIPALPGAPAYPLMNDRDMLRETLACMRDTGVQVFDVEIVWLYGTFSVDHYSSFLETAAELGARSILVGGGDPDEQRLADSYARFCEAARPFGLNADLEFMPWSTVRNAADAQRIVKLAGRPANAGILIDAVHFERSNTSLDDLRALPGDLLHYLQLCDCPAGIPPTMDSVIHTARHERLLPGEGGIDLKALLSSTPAGLPVSIELPNDFRIPALGYEEWARRALVAAKNL